MNRYVLKRVEAQELVDRFGWGVRFTFTDEMTQEAYDCGFCLTMQPSPPSVASALRGAADAIERWGAGVASQEEVPDADPT